MSFDTDLSALFQTYKDLLPMAQKDEDRLWQKFRLDWNYNSNRIEGNSLTYAETHALFILGTVPKRLKRDIREMKAHDVGIEYLRGLAGDERPISENDICELNKIIFKQNYWITTETEDGNVIQREIVPGTYKKTSNYVVLRGGGIHKFAEPFEVKSRMASTVKSIRAYVKEQQVPLTKYLAELHHDFINTHPFDDGNGRVCRLLLNYVCLKLGWPPVIIKDKFKDDYLVALEQSDSGDLSGLEAVMQSELEWSLKKAIAAAKGEDIEDADDIDKEVDLFVRENEPSFNGPANPKLIKNAYLTLIFPLQERLEVLVSQFQSHFVTYESVPATIPIDGYSKLKSNIQSDIIPESNRFAWNYNLISYKSETVKADIRIHIYISLDKEGCQISSRISTRRSIREIRPSKVFSRYANSKTETEDILDNFCRLTAKSVLNTAKAYKMLSEGNNENDIKNFFENFGKVDVNEDDITIVYDES